MANPDPASGKKSDPDPEKTPDPKPCIKGPPPSIKNGITGYFPPYFSLTVIGIFLLCSGAYQADVAVLVVNATTGEFEAGFEAGGQTR